MKRIAFYSREFRLCEWPAWSREPVEIYQEAVISAMENGVRFEDQDMAAEIAFYEMGKKSGPRPLMLKDINEGDNWPAPEGSEIEYQEKHNLETNWLTVSKEEWDEKGINYQFRKVAVLKSESVEKKETGKQRAYQKMLRYLISIRDSAAEAGELSFLPQAINTMTDIINDAINHSEYDR